MVFSSSSYAVTLIRRATPYWYRNAPYTFALGLLHCIFSLREHTYTHHTTMSESSYASDEEIDNGSPSLAGAKVTITYYRF